MITCEMCGHSNREQRRYCGSCGHPLGWWCSHCGFFNLCNESHCGGCGGLESKECNLPEKKSRSTAPPPQAAERPVDKLEKPTDDNSGLQPSDPPTNKDQLIERAIQNEIERMAHEDTDDTSTHTVSQDDIDKLFE